MRIIKLSTDIFEDVDSFDDFILNDLPHRTPPGLFLMGKQIGKDGLDIGERLIFSLDQRVIYIAKAASPVTDNRYDEVDDYERCFQVDLEAAQPVDLSLNEFSKRMNDAGLEVRTGGRGWNRFPDSGISDSIIDSLPKRTVS